MISINMKMEALAGGYKRQFTIASKPVRRLSVVGSWRLETGEKGLERLKRVTRLDSRRPATPRADQTTAVNVNVSVLCRCLTGDLMMFLESRV